MAPGVPSKEIPASRQHPRLQEANGDGTDALAKCLLQRAQRCGFSWVSAHAGGQRCGGLQQETRSGYVCGCGVRDGPFARICGCIARIETGLVRGWGLVQRRSALQHLPSQDGRQMLVVLTLSQTSNPVLPASWKGHAEDVHGRVPSAATRIGVRQPTAASGLPGRSTSKHTSEQPPSRQHHTQSRLTRQVGT